MKIGMELERGCSENTPERSRDHEGAVVAGVGRSLRSRFGAMEQARDFHPHGVNGLRVMRRSERRYRRSDECHNPIELEASTRITVRCGARVSVPCRNSCRHALGRRDESRRCTLKRAPQASPECRCQIRAHRYHRSLTVAAPLQSLAPPRNGTATVRERWYWTASLAEARP